MNIYCAPMEGITGYIFRNAHARYFGKTDKYFTPFLTPKPGNKWSSREKQDIMPEHNRGIPLVPQILTNRAEDMTAAARSLWELGYREINLNLGCPSGTVFSKKKGSGMLSDLPYLYRFFDRYFSACEMKLSVKTRLGITNPEEISALMEIYNAFPLTEIIIHARVREDYYKKASNPDGFALGMAKSTHPVCYNGDIRDFDSFCRIQDRFSQLDAVMLGRGLLANPQLPSELFGKVGAGQRDLTRWKAFHDEICQGYEGVMSGEKNVLFKMKELWFYMLPSFSCGRQYEKKIKKVKKLSEYRQIIEMLFIDEFSR